MNKTEKNEYMNKAEPIRDPSFWHGTFIPWFICLLAAIFYFYDFFLRVMPSVMIHPLMQNFNVSATTIGFISAFYYYAYTPLQIPSGSVVDKYSNRLVLTISALLCSAGAFLFAGAHSLLLIYIGRIFMGIGSAFAFVGTLKLAAVWLPRRQFALFTGITTALGTIGAICADTALSRMVQHWGWREASNLTAFVGLGLSVILIIFLRNRPTWIQRTSDEYRSWKSIGSRLWTLALSWRFWINGLVGTFLFLPISVFASLWGVAFILHTYHMQNSHAATITSLLFVGSVFGFPLAGWISDHLKKRRLIIFLGTLGALILSLAIIFIPELPLPVMLCLLFGIGMCVGVQSIVFAIAREVAPPRSTGIAVAFTNFVVTIGAAVFQPLIGYLLDFHWHGTVSPTGVHIYTTHDYQFALAVLPLLLALSLLFSFLIPKTFGKLTPDDSKHYH